MKKSTGDTRTEPVGFAKCMESFAFVAIAVITQYIIGFVKALSSEFHKSGCNLVQAQTARLNAWRLSSANKQLKLYILVYKSAVSIEIMLNHL